MPKQDEFISMVRIIEKTYPRAQKCPKNKNCKFICGRDGEIFSCDACKTATSLVNASIGDKKQAVKEFRQKLENKFSERISILKKEEITCEVISAKVRCKVAYTEIENVLNGFDELFTELYGEEI